jgi:hypothetical protein
MEPPEQNAQKIIMDLEKVNRFNEKGCAACGRKFSLGEIAVLACGFWEDGPKYIHENEAVFDRQTATYIERRCYNAGRQT